MLLEEDMLISSVVCVDVLVFRCEFISLYIAPRTEHVGRGSLRWDKFFYDRRLNKQMSVNAILLKECNEKINTPLVGVILNLILVYHGGRPGFLLETSGFSKNYSVNEVADYVQSLAEACGMSFTHDHLSVLEFPRFLVTKGKSPLPNDYGDEDLARALGFFCVGHRYSRQNLPRVGYTVFEEFTDVALTAEVCERSKINMEDMERDYSRLIDRWNDILSQYNPEFGVTLKVERLSSKKLRVRAVVKGDIDFIFENAEEYANDLYNDFADCSMFFTALVEGDRAFLVKNYMLFRVVYLGFQNIELPKYLSRYRRNPEEFTNTLCKFESSLLKLLRESDMLW